MICFWISLETSCPCLVNRDLHPPFTKTYSSNPCCTQARPCCRELCGSSNCWQLCWVQYCFISCSKFLSYEIGHHGVSLALTWDVVWSSKKVALLRGFTTHPIASKYIFKIQIYQFQIYVNDMNRVSTPQRRHIIYWTLPPNIQHLSHVSSCQVRFRGSTVAGIPMARDPNQMCHGGSVGSE